MNKSVKPLSVEDGMSDEQAKQICTCGHVRNWHSLSSTHWIPSSSGCLAPGGKCGCKQFVPLRPATPEELTAQAENRGKNYKPGPRQAVPFMPAEEEDADCEGCNRVDCKGCAYNDAHPPPDFVTKAGTRVYIPSAAVPVEERTVVAWMYRKYLNIGGPRESWELSEPRVTIDLEKTQEHPSGYGKWPITEIQPLYLHPTPIPEERTAEMEQVLATFKRAQRFIAKVDDLHQTIYASGLDEECQAAIALLEDHIEGKGK